MDTYDFTSKHLYRIRREISIDRLCLKNIKTRRVAYLDTGEALDTLSYLRRGYRPENLWAVNNNPAELAHLTRKLSSLNLPRINTVGLDLLKALEKRIPYVDIIDFDGMSNLSDNTMNLIGGLVLERGPIVYGVTILAGREKSTNMSREIFNTSNGKMLESLFTRTSFNTLINPSHVSRLRSILLAVTAANIISQLVIERCAENDHLIDEICTKFSEKSLNLLLDSAEFTNGCVVHVEDFLWDVYQSISRQPMLWAVIKIGLHRTIRKQDIKKILTKNGYISPPCLGDV